MENLLPFSTVSPHIYTMKGKDGIKYKNPAALKKKKVYDSRISIQVMYFSRESRTVVTTRELLTTDRENHLTFV